MFETSVYEKVTIEKGKTTIIRVTRVIRKRGFYMGLSFIGTFLGLFKFL